MLLLATDLDGTFLAGSEEEKLSLYGLFREKDELQLIFVTGRGVESVIPLLNDAIIPNPDYLICDVGATVLNGRNLEPVQPLQSQIERLWPGQLVFIEALKDVKGIRFQENPQERRCSFWFDEGADLDPVYKVAEQHNCDVLVSAGKYVDILPRGVNKGSTLTKLMKLIGYPEKNVLVAGDTLNDLSLYSTGYKGVVVGAAEAALVEQTKHHSHVYHAERPGTGGIVESFAFFPEFTGYKPQVAAQARKSAPGMTQLLMVYHRLPYELAEVNGEMKRVNVKSPNGIIPSLLGFFESGRSGSWIAWEENQNKKVQSLPSVPVDETRYPNLKAARIPMAKKDVEMFYKLFSKEAFWPTIFSFADRAKFNHEQWEHFQKVNRLFAEKTAAEADYGALAWIHDYNLWMVPAFLRILRPDLKIGFFHHTAFPPADIFNIIPWRRDIIGSLLQCDYVGFHIPRYVENFVDVVKSHTPIKVLSEVKCAPKFLTYSCALGVEKMVKEIDTGHRKVRMGAHPVGVNVENIKKLFADKEVQDDLKELTEQTRGKKIILSIERLDYVKGPLEKVRAFRSFLENYPEFHGKVELINICTPPAKGMKIYEKIEFELTQAIGEINGKFARLDWVPIRFFFRSLPFPELIKYYALADVAWITPLRDGLNLVAKEYVAVQGMKEKPDGVLIISEFAGASVELKDALLTNPYDIKNLQEVLLYAFTMEEHERITRMKKLNEIVTYYDIEAWSNEFLSELEHNGE